MCVGKQNMDFSDEILLVCKWDKMKLNLKKVILIWIQYI